MGPTYSDRGQLATRVYDAATIDTRANDVGGRMTSSSYSSGVSESITGTMSGYKFDALGRRVARLSESNSSSTHTIYFQSGQQTIADYTAGTTARSPTYSYVYESYIDEPVMRSTGSSGAKHFYHCTEV